MKRLSNACSEEVAEMQEGLPDPYLFDGLQKDETERWVEYLYRVPKNSEGKVTLKTRAFSLYDPFASRDVFPAGIRYCLNVYVGCSHLCAYCYIKNYIVRAEEPRIKKDLLKRATKDIADMTSLNLPPVPLHISNSTDPLQEPLEPQTGTTLSMMKLIAENRGHFTTITFLTKNPALLSCEPYLSLLKALNPCQVEVSLTFYDDEARRIYEPSAPSVESRLEGIRKLRKASINVSLRIDPLFPREPLPEPYWEFPELEKYGVRKAHSLEDIRDLIHFATSEGCQKIIVSPLKIPVGYRSSCWLKDYFHILYSEPFGGKPCIKGLALRLPEDYVYEYLFIPVIEICRNYRIPILHCKRNLITTK